MLQRSSLCVNYTINFVFMIRIDDNVMGTCLVMSGRTLTITLDWAPTCLVDLLLKNLGFLLFIDR